jgi:coenzyme F420-0:L-glutamate ligase/coenzyme F420-1:gamma-L-glutamate ligase
MNSLQIMPVEHIGEVTANTNLAVTIADALKKQSVTLENKDILVITQKVVSKAEGRIIDLRKIEPSDFAKKIAKYYQKEPAHIEVILRETKRIVRMDHGVIITETHNGFICANAGVDESNVGNNKFVTLLPSDPDASAKKLYEDISRITKIKKIGIIISDTWGRPWREGQVNFAIGLYGIEPLKDYRLKKDTYGYEMKASIIAVADELASASELVTGKISKMPVSLIRGYAFEFTQSNAKPLLRDPEKDMFR